MCNGSLCSWLYVSVGTWLVVCSIGLCCIDGLLVRVGAWLVAWLVVCSIGLFTVGWIFVSVGTWL